MISPGYGPRIFGIPGTALVVEPDFEDRVFLASILTSVGFRVTAIDNFRRAESILLARPPTVLVAEIRLEAYNGLHLALLGRFMRPHMAQFLTSRFHDEVLQRDIDRVGATFVLMPSTTERLLAALYSTLLREPNADGTVAPVRPRFESDRVECRQLAASNLAGQPRAHRKKRRRDTFPYLRAWRRQVS